MVYVLYKYAVWVATAAAIAYWLGRESWAALEFFALILLSAPFYGPLVYRYFRRRRLHARRDELGLPEATDQEVLAFITEALDEAYIDWEWRPSGRGAAQWREIAVGEGEGTLFVLAQNGVIEVQYTDEDPEVFLDAVETVQYIISLKGVPDPIIKEIPFDDSETNVPG